MRESWRGPQLGMWLEPPAPDALTLGLAVGMERRFGDWRKAQLAQGVMPGMLLDWGIREGEGKGEERSPASGYVANHHAEETARQR